jgi:hypothetical protein
MESVCLSAVERAERRIGHTALDLYNHLYVFGGWNAKKYLDHGCLLDIENEHLLIEVDATPARRLPPARRDHTLTRIGRQMFLFGTSPHHTRLPYYVLVILSVYVNVCE